MADRFDGRLTISGAILLALALLIGGGGAEGPLQNGLLEAAGAVLLVGIVASHFGSRPLPSAAILPVFCCALTLAIFIAQLVPLPAALWMKFPGREVAASAASLIGDGNAARPISLDPEATRLAAAALLLPIALMMATIRANAKGLVLLLYVIVIGAACGGALGAVQVATGTPESLAPYGNPEPGVASGFFANANHQASLMAVALVATSLLIRLQEPQIAMQARTRTIRFKLGWLFMPIFIIAILTTQSRAGLILLGPALVMAAIIASDGKSSRSIVLVLGLALASLLAVVLVHRAGIWDMLPGGSQFLSDLRVKSLPDMLYTMRQYWPWGSGFGTFVPVYMANENLNLVQAAYMNHAHNDFLELLIEGGILAAILLATVALVMLWRMLSLFRTAAAERAPALAGFAMLALLAAHSLADYPLRADAVAAVAGVAFGLLFVTYSEPAARRSTRRSRRGFSGEAR